MKMRLLIAFLMMGLGLDIQALVIGNFTTHDLRITVTDAQGKALRSDSILYDQHYTNVGDISSDQLPLVAKVWHKFESRRVEETVLAQFKIVSVQPEQIVFQSSDIWLIFQDDAEYDHDEPILRITNLASQDKELPEADRTKGLAPTPTPQIEPAKKEEVATKEPASSSESSKAKQDSADDKKSNDDSDDEEDSFEINLDEDESPDVSSDEKQDDEEQDEQEDEKDEPDSTDDEDEQPDDETEEVESVAVQSLTTFDGVTKGFGASDIWDMQMPEMKAPTTVDSWHRYN